MNKNLLFFPINKIVKCTYSSKKYFLLFLFFDRRKLLKIEKTNKREMGEGENEDDNGEKKEEQQYFSYITKYISFNKISF